MTAKEYLENDNSYCPVPIKTNNFRSKFFWGKAKENGQKPKDLFPERKIYEDGFYIGWEAANRENERNGRNPNPVNLTKKEYSDFMSVLTAFGYRFVYMTQPPAILKDIDPNVHGFTPGLNICKDPEAIKAGVVISDEAKERILQIIKTKLW